MDLKSQWLQKGAPLTMEERLVTFRQFIQDGRLAKKETRVLFVSAYNEMRYYQGKNERKMDCGDCMNQIYSQLLKWFALYDKRTPLQSELAKKHIEVQLEFLKSKKAKYLSDERPVRQSILPKELPKLKPLQPKTSNSNNNDNLIGDDSGNDNLLSKYKSMDFQELLDMIKLLPAESQEKLDKEKSRNFPKKSEIIKELIEYKI